MPRMHICVCVFSFYHLYIIYNPFYVSIFWRLNPLLRTIHFSKNACPASVDDRMNKSLPGVVLCCGLSPPSLAILLGMVSACLAILGNLPVERAKDAVWFLQWCGVSLFSHMCPLLKVQSDCCTWAVCLYWWSESCKWSLMSWKCHDTSCPLLRQNVTKQHSTQGSVAQK